MERIRNAPNESRAAPVMLSEVEQMCSVDLLFKSPPEIQPDLLSAAIQKTCPDIKRIGDLAFVHTSHLVQYQGGAAPAQLLITPGKRGPDKINIGDAIEQSWNLPDAATVVRNLPHKVLVQDLMARGLPPRERLTIFLNALDAVVATLHCEAIHWRNSQQVTSVEYFLEARRDASRHMLFGGPLNVRFFKTSGSHPDEAVADTRGLSVFGLPDIQCHFHGLGMDQLFPFFCDLGVYLFEKGDVIESGNTIPGVDGTNWRCRHATALIPPNRGVLDIDPGPQYAAGDRH